MDTFKKYHPVTLIVGIGFVASGVWAAFMFLPGTPTLEGLAFILLFFVVIPVTLGAAIIQNQLRLRRKSN